MRTGWPSAALRGLVSELAGTTWPGAGVNAYAVLQKRGAGGSGRAVARLSLRGGAPATCVLKWRDDREDDREGLLYARVLDAVLLAPRLYAAASRGRLHALLMEDVAGRPVPVHDPVAMAHAFAALGAAHAESHRRVAAALHGDLLALVRPGAEANANERVLRELGLAAATVHDPQDPPVLDQGDLRPENLLLGPEGRVCLVDYENAAVRRRSTALADLLQGRHGWSGAGVAGLARAHAAYMRGWDGGG